MRLPSVAALCVAAIALTGVSFAGPANPLYLTYTFDLNGGNSIVVVQGNTLTSFAEAYGPPDEVPIAVAGDVRTTGNSMTTVGGQYSLAGAPTGTTYVLSGIASSAYDSTTDGSHNFLVDYTYSGVYMTDRDFKNTMFLFTANDPYNVGITYDATNKSLWISGFFGSTMVTDYSMDGTILFSFDTGHYENGALAMDPATHTLWLVNGTNGELEQYSTAGVRLSTGPYVGYALGGEFDLGAAPLPEGGTLMMFGSGLLGLASVLRRKINL